MDTEQLVSKLNWFYSLEINQVDLYQAQSKSFSDLYSGLIFERVSAIEQGHVDNIKETIKRLGGTPTKLGAVISPIIGTIGGTVIGLAGINKVLRANIAIEEKAMEDYKNLIKILEKDERTDKDLIKLLKFNFIDEHLHVALFQAQLNDLINKSF
jgi:bacterioferritin